MPTLSLPDGRRLAYREVGHGAPLVLVHGSPGDGRAWARVAPHLAGQFRLLMPDLPGYGGSDPLPPGTAARTAAMGAAVAALVAGIEGPVILAGHSYGGNVALQAALQMPERIDRLCLFEPVLFRALALAEMREVLEPAERFFRGYTDRVDAGETAAVSEMVDFWFGAGAFTGLSSPVQAYLQGAAALNAIDVRASLGETTPKPLIASFARPVLLAHGERSPPVIPAIVEALARLLPHVRCTPIAGATHGMLDSHPAAVAASIAEFAAA